MSGLARCYRPWLRAKAGLPPLQPQSQPALKAKGALFSSSSTCLIQDQTLSREGEMPPLGGSQTPGKGRNYARNNAYRNAFRKTKTHSLEMEKEITKLMSSAYVPEPSTYPNETATKSSLARSQRLARVQAGHQQIARRHGYEVPEWWDVMNHLRRMTPNDSDQHRMATVRVALPPWVEVDVGTRKLDFIDAAGLRSKLRVSSSDAEPSVIILRGRRAVIAKAVDELLKDKIGDKKISPEQLKIFDLGSSAMSDGEARQMWPNIDPSVSKDLLSSGEESVWVHKEPGTYWIEQPYEETPLPESLSCEAVEAHITALTCGRLRPHLVTRFYRRDEENGDTIDADAVRIKMIMDVFDQPQYRPFITPATLKRAVRFLSMRGGHRVSAYALFNKADKWGLPMDTDLFNIVLGGYATHGDARQFHNLLFKMESLYFQANAETWLQFLRLVQSKTRRQQVIASMYDIGLLGQANQRGLAAVMASEDAYAGLSSGMSVEELLASQARKYGKSWLSSEALSVTVWELVCFRMPTLDSALLLSDVKVLFEAAEQQEKETGLPCITIATLNVVLELSAIYRSKALANWALDKIDRRGIETDSSTYLHLLYLAAALDSPRAMGIVILFACLEQKLEGKARYRANRLLLGQYTNRAPLLLSQEVAKQLRNTPAKDSSRALTAVAGAMRDWVSRHGGTVPRSGTLRKLLFQKAFHSDREEAIHGTKISPVRVPIIEVDKTKQQQQQLKPVRMYLMFPFDPKTMLKDGGARLEPAGSAGRWSGYPGPRMKPARDCEPDKKEEESEEPEDDGKEKDREEST